MPIALSGGITLSEFGNDVLYEVFIDIKEVNAINEQEVTKFSVCVAKPFWHTIRKTKTDNLKWFIICK